MESVKQTLLTNWHFMRLVRLIIGIVISVQAFQAHDALIGIVAFFVLFQAISNKGCCGSNSCDLSKGKNEK